MQRNDIDTRKKLIQIHFFNANLNGDSGSATPTKNRVSLLSQHIEDCFGDTKPPALPGKKPSLTTMRQRDDAVSLASTLSTLSGCSMSENNTINIQIKLPIRPPTATDSGKGNDSDTETEGKGVRLVF